MLYICIEASEGKTRVRVSKLMYHKSKQATAKKRKKTLPQRKDEDVVHCDRKQQGRNTMTWFQ